MPVPTESLTIPVTTPGSGVGVDAAGDCAATAELVRSATEVRRAVGRSGRAMTKPRMAVSPQVTRRYA
jgi:hypothetical protein